MLMLNKMDVFNVPGLESTAKIYYDQMKNIINDYHQEKSLTDVTISENAIASDLQQLISRGNIEGNVLLSTAIQQLKDKKIVLFDSLSYNRYGILPSILFIPNKLDGNILYNVSKVGSWGKTTYELTSGDLKYALTAATVAYDMFSKNKIESYSQNQKIVSAALRIYTKMFEAVIGSLGIVLDQENREYLRYCIGKFYCMHSLEYKKEEAEKISSKAILQSVNTSTEYLLKDFEEVHSIEYSSLMAFISSIGKAFISKEITISEIYNKWVGNYGASTQFAIEYFPYLLCCVIGIFYNSNVTKILGTRKQNYLKDVNIIMQQIESLYY